MKIEYKCKTLNMNNVPKIVMNKIKFKYEK